MKIGFDAKRYYHNRTGLGNYSRSLVSGLQQSHPEVECVLYDAKSLERTFRLGQRAKAENCDLLHGLSNELPLNIRQSGIPSVVTMHDVAWRTFPRMYHWIDRHLYDLKYGHSCQAATRVIAISESTKRDVMRYYGVPEERIEVIYQPVQSLFYEPLTQDRADELIGEAVKQGELTEALPTDGFVLNVGSINARKNLLGLVQALEVLPAERRPLLLVVGNGREYKREVLDYVARHQLEPYFRLETGVRDNRTLQALYSCCTLMAYPSYYEGFGLPVVEAALQQTPVLTTTVSSLPEAAGPDACYVDPHATDAVEQIAAHLELLCSSHASAHDIGLKLEAYARRMFAPRRLTDQVVGCYERALGQSSRS